jgi:hypothetical protein
MNLSTSGWVQFSCEKRYVALKRFSSERDAVCRLPGARVASILCFRMQKKGSAPVMPITFRASDGS